MKIMKTSRFHILASSLKTRGRPPSASPAASTSSRPAPSACMACPACSIGNATCTASSESEGPGRRPRPGRAASTSNATGTLLRQRRPRPTDAGGFCGLLHHRVLKDTGGARSPCPDGAGYRDPATPPAVPSRPQLKCAFFREEVALLGHKLFAEGLGVDPQKLRAIQVWPPRPLP